MLKIWMLGSLCKYLEGKRGRGGSLKRKGWLRRLKGRAGCGYMRYSAACHCSSRKINLGSDPVSTLSSQIIHFLPSIGYRPIL
ncbi:hypothetical protein OPV22_025439 [Ensete ventricosum]|uniref:Uncharacterized protein n=1 Tax=Ensete ventricosum TaxID=4639 RepID=A0AAV8Q7F0_ENSVE|nr:hypothetical protein OPV22_025439 [Ensete ventricosum]